MRHDSERWIPTPSDTRLDRAPGLIRAFHDETNVFLEQGNRTMSPSPPPKDPSFLPTLPSKRILSRVSIPFHPWET
jgi:hypothetical protein